MKNSRRGRLTIAQPLARSTPKPQTMITSGNSILPGKATFCVRTLDQSMMVRTAIGKRAVAPALRARLKRGRIPATGSTASG
ncbi:MAG: hypothetical protein ACTHM0_02755 [Sphingomonas sp.]